jgi:Uncharacterized protein conserved in bacteria
MKELMLMYARYTQRTNADVVALLDKLTVEQRNENRKSYYKSLSGLALHAFGGVAYFHGLFRQAVPSAAGALKSTEGLVLPPEGDAMTAAQWADLKKGVAIGDAATVDFIGALSEIDFDRPVKIDWFGGKPDAVPLHWMLNSSFVHGTHHRGQISQILDEMGIEHDFSGFDLEFIAK